MSMHVRMHLRRKAAELPEQEPRLTELRSGRDLLIAARLGRIKALEELSSSRVNFFHDPQFEQERAQESGSVMGALQRLKRGLPAACDVTPRGLPVPG